MSRVAQLDSVALDEELRSIFWRDFQSNVPISRYKEELQLLLQTLVFFCGAKKLPAALTDTYGSQLSGVSYICSRRALYLITILASYVESKLSHFVFSSTTMPLSSSSFMTKMFRYFSTVYSAFDLLVFAKFLAKASSFPSPLHRLFGVSFTSVIHATATFHDNTVHSQIEFQNRQLLWNAILELFNVTLLSNAKLLKKRYSKNRNQLAKRPDDSHCAYCDEFPTSPYTISCCKATFCYVCVVKTLEWSSCPACNSTNNLAAAPLY